MSSRGVIKAIKTKIKPLDAIAAEIRREHEAVKAAFRSAVEHALIVGNLLIQSKAQVKHGEWEKWVAVNTTFSLRTARGYVQLARRWLEFDEGKRRRVADLGLRAALQEVADPQPTYSPIAPGSDDGTQIVILSRPSDSPNDAPSKTLIVETQVEDQSQGSRTITPVQTAGEPREDRDKQDGNRFGQIGLALKTLLFAARNVPPVDALSERYVGPGFRFEISPGDVEEISAWLADLATQMVRDTEVGTTAA